MVLLIMIIGCIALMSSGAFTSITAQRSATINVVGDGSALLSIAPADGPNGSYAEIVGGKLVIDIPNMNSGASATINNVFTVTNNSNHTISLSLEKHGDNANYVWFIVLHYIGVTLDPGESYTESIGLATQELVAGNNMLESITLTATIVE